MEYLNEMLIKIAIKKAFKFDFHFHAQKMFVFNGLANALH